MLGFIFVAAILLQNFVICVPIDSTTESLVIVGDTSEILAKPKAPELTSMHVTSNIRNRYARTTVETKYSNPENHAQEATFTITLPDTAFISGFIMEIDGRKYEAYVKGKEEAKKDYQDAVQRGQTAGHVEMNARDSEIFTVSVNVEPLSKVLFTLTYEQLLKRKHGKYEMVINLHPRQLVDVFSVDVNINETRRIIDVSSPALRSGNEILDERNIGKNQFATISNLNDDQTEVNVHFAPSKDQQIEMMVGSKGVDENRGISGQFVIQYDVERDPQGGEVIVNDGYFVHFFAPSDLEPIPKHIVFVLDVSGSMMGRKIKQLKTAMKVILGELSKDDYFHLVKFSTSVQIWNEDWKNVENPSEFEAPDPLPADEKNIEKVQNVVSRMSDEGMTNIHDALAVALRLTSTGVNQHNEIKQIQPIIVFLTDGQANQGKSHSNEILEMVDSRNDVGNKAAIFTLSFGDYANKDLLKNLASQNLGFMRTIYEAADASLQLQDFYKTISSPLLTNVNFIYSDQVSDLTKNTFNILFKGSELVVAGKLTDLSQSFANVQAKTVNGTHKFIPAIFPLTIRPKPETKREYGSLERLWAYMTIQQLLNKKYERKDKDKNSSSEKEALNIALKYSFVTPVSSLVVVKPNSTESQNTKAATNNPEPHRSRAVIPAMMSPHTSSPQYRYSQSRSSGFLRFGGGAGGGGGGRGHVLSSMSAPQMTSFQMLPIASYDTAFVPSQHYLENDLTWITTFITGPDEIQIDSHRYLIGSNSTTVQSKTCQVNSLNLNGMCTLLSACPKIYPTLDSANTYRKYFCTLESGRHIGFTSIYAGVCCVDN